MKACEKCKVPDLSLLTRIFVVADIFRLFILLGPMLIVFHACTNLHPMLPTTFSTDQRGNANLFILYKANRQNVSYMEDRILGQVDKDCGPEYRNNLPDIWKEATHTLYKSLYLLGIASTLPLVTSVSYLVFHKRERIAFAIGFLHLCFVMIAVILGVYGVWFSFDSRLCLLQALSNTISIPACFCSGVVIYAVLVKTTSLLILNLFVKSRFKTPKAGYYQPSPAEELVAYLREMRLYNTQPKVTFEFPENPKTLTWEAVEEIIKKILVDVRIQVAELHKDDPLVNDLLQSGKLHGTMKKKKKSSGGDAGEDGGAPSILKIVKSMLTEGGSSEYNLLKKHKHGHEMDVDVILPEPDLRSDDDL